MLRVPRQDPPQELRLLRIDGGLSTKYLPSQIRDNQSPYMLNMTADDRGALVKRHGQKVIHELEGSIHAMDHYKGQLVVAHGDKITALEFNASSDNPVTNCLGVKREGLQDSKGSFFVMNDKLYYLNGRDYVVYDGETVKEVEPYIPTLLVSKLPEGGGEPLEDWNYLGSGFREKFSADGTKTAYHLSQKELDDDLVTVSVDGNEMTEGNGFTVNRETGVVTFTTAPPQTAPNNVIITAFKTYEDKPDMIKKCKYSILYGGKNDTRVFVAGNDDEPNHYFYSDLYKPEYFPENNFNRIGSDLEPITGFVVQYDILVIFKERSIYSLILNLDNGVSSFPVKPINTAIGCDMPYTIQIVDNSPVFCTTNGGVHILRSSQVRDERNVRLISSNISGAYEREGFLDVDLKDLKEATSVVWSGKYYLVIKNIAWVWDFYLSPYIEDDEALTWFKFDNFNANCFIVLARKLYYGDRQNGALCTTTNDYEDFGESINGIWRSKLYDFNLPDYLKTISELWYTVRSDTYTRMKVNFLDDKAMLIHDEEIVISRFRWDNFGWAKFSWQVIHFSRTIRRKPKLKKTVYFQIEFSNNIRSQNLSILSLIIRYIVTRKVK